MHGDTEQPAQGEWQESQSGEAQPAHEHEREREAPIERERRERREMREGREGRGEKRRRADDFVAPGVPIVRSSTPRPPSLALGEAASTFGPRLTDGGAPFPEEAPAAPPVPEAYSSLEETPLPIASQAMEKEDVAASTQPGQERNEFLWLFEYGPEMDTVVLNSPQLLDGLALPYGPGMLKGYELGFGTVRTATGEVVASILPSSDPAAAVWGMLYRVPRRLALPAEDGVVPLDKAHDAVPPIGLFEPLTVVVHEPLRQREITCTTYIASATVRKYFQPCLPERYTGDPYVRHLLESARRQKLPESYLLDLEGRASPSPASAGGRSARGLASGPGGPAIAHHLAQSDELDTEPIVAVSGKDERERPTPALPSQTQAPGTTLPKSALPAPAQSAGPAEPPPAPAATRPAPQGWLLALSVYHALLLLAVLALAISEGLGFGQAVFTPDFAPFGVPWLVLAYGLLGGCVSCLVSLRQSTSRSQPLFLLITWFVRPYLGMVLAMLAYLLLDSGLVVLGSLPGHTNALFSLVGMLAGYCEHRFFFQRPSA
ncbi:gamma-glutamylcyclotransferase family protein [Thermogemmatispora carboxidivorans]|uniref:gamma-glutamylcyclotransferase family protein n=1 Tax=Thermogemmatispora carboxidivorans TaxID=1382306 RepID=UPI00069C0D04|nr:gamma-glutamylcyclotransferase family protein [Thermogemmatispora carboxidivorans]